MNAKTIRVNQVYKIRWPYLFIFIVILHLVPPSAAQAEQPEKKSEQQKQLERYANDSLRRLEYAIQTGGFFYSRSALNIWKDNAEDAGMFDESLYNQYKRKIYEKSVNENLKWFEIFLIQKNHRDAGTCLQLYKMHAEEINVFDKEKYEEMQKRLKK
ncbi:MAG TPA: hypothetical protein HPQ03_12595 [Deltaproteobacteria bacterium]|nr:hypothetical protein [Deltaproteobacteria bacterium]